MSVLLTIADAALPTLNQARELLVERAMSVLGAWALLNLLFSGYHVARTDPRTVGYHFHLLNVGWNVVNALLAVVGLLRAHPADVATMTLGESIVTQTNYENLLLVSVVLDVAYIGLGSWLRARADTATLPVRWLGFGYSLWLQGGFLLLFDAGFYGAYHQFAASLLQLSR